MPRQRQPITRRRFLRASAAVSATGLLAACGGAPQSAPPGSDAATAPAPAATPAPEPTSPPTTAPAPAATTAAEPTRPAASAVYGEAPMLADLVQQGALPPVDERLPETPLVVEPVEQIGQYGGDWRTALVGGGDQFWLERTIGNNNLVRWNIEWTGVYPNIAESIEVNDEATEYTFNLRPGTRWSDGEPFTADDIMFWYESVFSNPDLTPSQDSWLVSGGAPVTVEKVDDYAVLLRFSAPNGLLLQNIARGGGAQLTSLPRHYMQQFHQEHNTENLDELIAEAGVSDWMQLFQLRADRWANGDLPTLLAWRMNVPYGETTSRVVAERNPYFWKIDPDGNQLPYLDRVTYEVVGDTEVLVLKALNGEIDMQDRHIATLNNKAIFTDGMQQGDYRFFETIPSSSNDLGIYLNFNHNDPVKRAIIQNKDFRIGLSHAINRQEIIDLIYIGQGLPYQVASRPESQFYDEEFGTQFTTYDLDAANAALDRAGLIERDAEGFRLGPDGARVSLDVEIITTNQNWIDAMGLIQQYWAEVGIAAQAKVEDRSLLWERKNAAEHDAMIWTGDSGIGELVNPSRYFPQFNGSHFAVRWAAWYINPDDPFAEEPPEPTRRQMELYDQVKQSSDPARQEELMREILQIAKEQFYLIGVVLPANGYGIVKNNFHNVPATMFSDGSVWINPAPTNPEQFFKQG